MKLFSSIVILAFTLCECSSNDTTNKVISNETKPAKKISKLWLGKWERKEWQNGATLNITSIQSDSIKFSMYAASGGHTGEIEGMAAVTDSIAIFINNDETDTCLIKFKLIGDSIISINQKGGNCFTGASVSYDGEFKNSKMLPKVEKIESLVDLGVFNTKKEDSLFKSLVGDSYSLFVNSTQLTSDDDDLDSLNATVRSSGVRGLYTFMENIIMTDSLNNIWAAVIDNEKVYYFTNKQEYKRRLPKTVDNWRQNFKEYRIIYR